MIRQVLEFHQKFGLPTGEVDVLSQDQEAQDFRVRFMIEELEEFDGALTVKDRVKALDALLDLVYVVYGTALFMGITPDKWKRAMDAVHNCNMSKVRVLNGAESKRGSAFDVRKPTGWVGPESKLEEILDEA